MTAAVSFGPTFASKAAGHALAALLMVKQGRLEQAALRLRQAVKLEPRNPQWHLELARVLREKTPAEAAESYATAIGLGSDFAALEAVSLPAFSAALTLVTPCELWTPDRLDIAAKVLFAENYLGKESQIAASAVNLYRQHILQRTGGQEPGSAAKQSVADYELAFASLIESIREGGFKEHAAVPVDDQGRLLNGAHRVAAAIALGLRHIPVVRLPVPRQAPEWGAGWFLHHGFSPDEIHGLLRTWIRFHPGTARLLLLEHGADGLPPALWTELTANFRIVAWRALAPHGKRPRALPCPQLTLQGPMRYVLLDADDSALATFARRQHMLYGDRVRCHTLSAQESCEWASHLLDERSVAALHPQAPAWAGEEGVAHWIAYANPPLPCNAGPGFAKWRNLERLPQVHTVIDVGVAYGTPDLYRHVRPAHVVFIEPVPSFAAPIEALQKQFASSQYLPFGLGSCDTTAVIHYRDDAPVLTSLLQSSALRDTGSERITDLPVTLRRLDSVFAQIRHTDSTTLLKIDTEGYELEVLKGATESLRKIKYLMMELSVIERFEGSYTCSEIVEFLRQHGFVLHTCLSASVDAQGYCRVVDAVFANTRLP